MDVFRFTLDIILMETEWKISADLRVLPVSISPLINDD